LPSAKNAYYLVFLFHWANLDRRLMKKVIKRVSYPFQDKRLRGINHCILIKEVRIWFKERKKRG
jgi:hypothetical protein